MAFSTRLMVHCSHTRQQHGVVIQQPSVVVVVVVSHVEVTLTNQQPVYVVGSYWRCECQQKKAVKGVKFPREVPPKKFLELFGCSINNKINMNLL